jgi:hypothetical protein
MPLKEEHLSTTGSMVIRVLAISIYIVYINKLPFFE